MNADAANEILRQLTDRFPEKRHDRKLLSMTQECLLSLQFSSGVVAQAVAELITDPKATFPTPQAIRGACQSAARPDAMAACEQRAEMLLEKHGRDLLSIRCKRADEVCDSCATVSISHGVDPNDPILRHRHITTAEQDRDTALTIAIEMAQFGSWSKRRGKGWSATNPYNGLRAKWTRQPSADDEAANALANQRRFAELKAVLVKPGSRAGRGMDAVEELKNAAVTS